MRVLNRLLVAPVLVLVAGMTTAGDPEEEGVLPRWNFQEERQLVYAMQANVRINAGEAGRHTAAGTLHLNAANGKAEMVVRLAAEDEEDAAQEERIIIREDGRVDGGRYPPGINAQLMLDMMFPLPDNALEPGKPRSQSMVLYTFGTPDLRGEAVFELLGEEQIDGRTYLRYVVRIDLSAAGAGDEPVSELKAKVECLFDAERGQFRSSTTQIDWRMDALRLEQEIRLELEREVAGADAEAAP